MNLRIQWTPIALLSLSEVFEYTYTEFGERQLRKLKTQISNTKWEPTPALPKGGSLNKAQYSLTV